MTKRKYYNMLKEYEKYHDESLRIELLIHIDKMISDVVKIIWKTSMLDAKIVALEERYRKLIKLRGRIELEETIEKDDYEDTYAQEGNKDMVPVVLGILIGIVLAVYLN